MATWKDGTTTARTGAQFEASVMSETFINVDHPDFGGDIQAAIDAHTAGVIYIPAKSTVRTQTSAISLPNKISLLGDGREGTILDWATSLGSGVWAVAPSTTQGTYYHNTIKGIQFRGPSYGDALVFGTAGTDMHGIKYGRRTFIDDFIVSGFHSGLGVWADHNGVSNGASNSNHFNLRFLDNSSHFGDNHFHKVSLDTCSLASVAVDTGGGAQGCTFTACHFGFGPYAWYGDPSRTGTFMDGVTTINCAHESLGNALIYSDSSASKVLKWRDTGSSSSYNSAKAIVGGDGYQYLFKCSSFEECVIPAAIFANAPSVAWIGCTDATQKMRYTEIKDTNNVTSSIPIFVRVGGTEAPLRCTWTGRERRGRIVKSTDTVAVNELAMVTGIDTVAKYDGTKGPAGVMRDALSANQSGRMVTGGTNLAITDATVAAGDLIKPGSTAGRVTKATGWSDGPIIGVAWSGATAGNTFTCEFRGLGDWS